MYCWGRNNVGQLGNASNTDSNVPVAVDTSGVLNNKTIKYVKAGGGSSNGFSCAVTSEELVYCWGYNTEGQLGNNTTVNSNIPVPVDMSGVLNGKTIKKITIGSYHTCVIASDDNPYCWGKGTKGVLGNRVAVSSFVPVAVDLTSELNGFTVKEISTGGGSGNSSSFSCVIKSNDQPSCWGSNSSSQLGNSSKGSGSYYYPLPFSYTSTIGEKIIDIANSTATTCILNSNSQIFCWGDNLSGQVGAGIVSNTSGTPKKVLLP